MRPSMGPGSKPLSIRARCIAVTSGFSALVVRCILLVTLSFRSTVVSLILSLMSVAFSSILSFAVSALSFIFSVVDCAIAGATVHARPKANAIAAVVNLLFMGNALPAPIWLQAGHQQEVVKSAAACGNWA